MGYIVEGTMTPGDLVGVSLSIHEIVWTVRYLIDLVPQMVNAIPAAASVALYSHALNVRCWVL